MMSKIKGHSKENLNVFFKSLSYGMVYEVLENASKDKEELEKIAEKHHLKLPSKDLAVFKGIYAFVNEENKNGCTLPREEVEKALVTLNGKSVDFDHLRKKIVGYWLEGAIEKDTIVAYGIFFKGSLQDEYVELKKMLTEGNLKISFEAWGTKTFTNESETSYDLSDIEFAGGALLLTTKPAFSGAKVLEFAKDMTEPLDFFHDLQDVKEEKERQTKFLEYSRFYTSDMDVIARLLWEVVCPGCEEQYPQQIDSIDYENSTIGTTCYNCQGKNQIQMSPRVKKMETARSIEKIAKIEATVQKIEEKLDKSLIVSEDDNNMDEKVKLELEQAIEALKAKVVALEAEKVELSAKITEQASAIETAKADAEALKVSNAEAIEVAKAQATLVANRRTELTEEYAKELKDEDILDEVKFENAKLKKENVQLKAKAKVETASEKVTKEEVSLEAGSKQEAVDPILLKSKNVRELAFGK